MRNFQLPGRSPVVARHAMAATSHPLASLAAIECLKRGGNAIDAAITATALLCVIEPAMTGIGGDCFALLHKPGKKLIALNASGRAPIGASADFYAKAAIKTIEVTSPHAVTIPGAIDGWATLLSDHGTMALGDVLQPAIEAAQGGFAVAPRVASDWAGLSAKVALHAGARKHLLVDGRTPECGEVMRFPALARTLKLIAKQGRDGFYDGEIAADIVATLQPLGGLHTPADFAANKSTYVTPMGVPYNGVELFELPPNNQGIVALILLKMLAKLGRLGDAVSIERYHVSMEAARLAYAARDRFVADPEKADVPSSYMLSDRFISELVGRIDRAKHRPELGPIPEPTGTDTTYLTVVDKDGMAVSFINSLFAGFGSGIVTEKTGVVLQNRGSGFVLDPNHRNCIAPGKRPLHTLVPAMALRDGQLWLSFGVMGGAFQAMGHAYVLSNMVDYGHDVQEAIDFPRIFFEGGKLQYEDGIPEAIVKGLRAKGHSIDRRPDPWGGGQAVMIDANGIRYGGSDPRKDGAAIGY